MSKLSDIAKPRAIEVPLQCGKAVVIQPVSLLTMMEIEEAHGVSIDIWLKGLMNSKTLREKCSALWMLVSNKGDFESMEGFFGDLAIPDMKRLEEAIVHMATRSMPAAGTATAQGGGDEGNGPSSTGQTTSRPSRARTATRSKKSSR